MSIGFLGLVAVAVAAAAVFRQIKVSHQSELLRRANDCCCAATEPFTERCAERDIVAFLYCCCCCCGSSFIHLSLTISLAALTAHMPLPM